MTSRSNEESRCIWSLALGKRGIGTTVQDDTGSLQTRFYAWPLRRFGGVSCIEICDVKKTVANTLVDLISASDSVSPVAITISSDDESSAVFVDAHTDCITPVFLELPHPVPKSEIPAKYASSPNLSGIYRESVLRRLRQTNPLLGHRHMPGIYSLGAIIAFWLTGHGVSSCMPLGVPPQFPEFDDESRKSCFEALGVDPALCMSRCRCGHAFAKVSPYLVRHLDTNDAPQLDALAGTPVFDMGCCSGACAYAAAASPISWEASVGFDLRAHWTSSVSALAAYEISIIDKSSAVKPETVDPAAERDELSADDWTRLIVEHITPDIHPGPGPSLAVYGCRCPSLHSALTQAVLDELTRDDHLRFDFKSLSRAPLGSHGLHVFYTQNGWRIAGMTAAHEPSDFARALFEGLCYTLRRWYDAIPTDRTGPVRLILEPPWPVECARWAADILEKTVYLVGSVRETVAAQGAAIVLLRTLEIPTRPTIRADVIEPGPGSACYRTHYRVHCALARAD